MANVAHAAESSVDTELLLAAMNVVDALDPEREELGFQDRRSIAYDCGEWPRRVKALRAAIEKAKGGEA